MNYFELFNIPVSFEVDLAELSNTYQQLQRLTHPDRFSQGSEQDKLVAMQKNAQVNDAYSVLKKPLSRAEHILALGGIELKHEQQTIKDSAFLIQQMELREQLAEIDDQAEPLEQLDSLEKDIKASIKTELAKLQSLLESKDSLAKEQAADMIRKLKFLYKMLSEIALKEEALSDL